jgi:hypothetical protein
MDRNGGTIPAHTIWAWIKERLERQQAP